MKSARLIQEEKISEIHEKLRQLKLDFNFTNLSDEKRDNLHQELFLHRKEMNKAVESFNDIQKQLQELRSRPNEYQMRVLFAKAKENEQVMEKISSDIEQIAKQLEVYSGIQYESYISLTKELNFYKYSLSQLKKSEKESGNESDIDSTMHQAKDKISALEKNPNPGRALVRINLFEALNNSQDWQVEFFAKHKDFSIEKQDDQNELKLISADRKNIITVDKECININSPSSSAMVNVVDVMIDLYLKGIEGKNVFAHAISSENDEMQDMMEKTLAKKLDERGVTNSKINGKSLQEISPQHEKSISNDAINASAIAAMDPDPGMTDDSRFRIK